jgi:hypothetical protein
LKNNCGFESKSEVSIQNGKKLEADPIEENIIIPIIHPIRVKDVVDGNEDTAQNTITVNKCSDRSHY